MKKHLLLLLAGTALLAACKKTDKEKPSFTISTPADSSVFVAGQTIPFVAAFADNEALSQYKIDIHDNFDGHSHEKYIANIWTQIFIENINGTAFNENKSILVPDSTAAGWYHFLVTVVDEAGNQSETAFHNIYIQNSADTSRPQLTVNSPADGFAGTLGSPVAVNLDIADNEWVYIVKTQVKRPNSSNTLFQTNDTLDVSPTANVVKEITTTGSAWSTGNYELTITTYDSYFNRTSKVVPFSLN